MPDETRHGARSGGSEPEEQRPQPRSERPPRHESGEQEPPDMAAALEAAGIQSADSARRHQAEFRSFGRRAEDLVAWVKARPLASALIGVAVGYLLARMAHR